MSACNQFVQLFFCCKSIFSTFLVVIRLQIFDFFSAPLQLNHSTFVNVPFQFNFSAQRILKIMFSLMNRLRHNITKDGSLLQDGKNEIASLKHQIKRTYICIFGGSFRKICWYWFVEQNMVFSDSEGVFQKHFWSSHCTVCEAHTSLSWNKIQLRTHAINSHYVRML